VSVKIYKLYAEFLLASKIRSFRFSLSADEYAQLMCNFIEIVECHEDLYQRLEECSNDRVGKIFLAKAPIMKKVHQQYCALHPRAIVIVDKYK
jgi:Rho guanine nucleotide exchange factor 7